MALKSAELAGIPIPEATRQGIIRFLRSVSSGSHGGLASYRPGEQATRTMTAEALVCWQFLGMRREDPASNEAGDFLLGQLPGQGVERLLLVLRHAGHVSVAGRRIGGAGTRPCGRSCWPRQHPTARLAGSWDPDAAWGSYGGRIYSTSLSALCLEVYYRYLPLYAQSASRLDSR